MTELQKILNRRQSCRHFSEKPVEDEKIVACINAASLAPSACNTQPYHFYVAVTPPKLCHPVAISVAHTFKPWSEPLYVNVPPSQ